MSTVLVVARHMRRLLWRDHRWPACAAIVVILALIAGVLESQRIAAFEQQRVVAEQVDRATFEAQGARNPHSVAHFSRFAFRPWTPAVSLDPGTTRYAGSAVWMEAHRQDPANVRPAEDEVDLGRFNDLSITWLVQVLLPLLVIVQGYDAVGRDREDGTLSLALAGGVPLRHIVAGKQLALFQIFGFLMAVCAGALWLWGAVTSPLVALPDLTSRTLLWLGAHLTYLAVWISLVTVISLVLNDRRTAFATALAVWAMAVLVVPRLAATTADALHPAPSPTAFFEAIRNDLAGGVDGHASAGERRQAFEREVLARYGVARKEDLPVSLAGLALQEGEEQGNRVFDRHFGRLADAYAAQQRTRRWWSVASPMPVLQHLSMAAASTDVAHQLDFVRQAEATRRDIVRGLNDDMTRHGKGKDFNYAAAPELWKTIPEFAYRPPRMASMWAGSTVDAVVLLAWLMLAGWTTRSAVRRMERPR